VNWLLRLEAWAGKWTAYLALKVRGAVSGISPEECDVTVGESNQPMVGDGDTMDMGTEIAQRMFRAAKWSLA
jgi:hypothetical protein